ncbi:MAG: bifunctional methylenetetrahydrofolate dehydrogenase/methenyltetrahydrofolate cyclohydrolase FolD [Candidatus Marinimicrobia bacterium]|nr:bifunctional methylenetetrahydrofolate dehydrogenase/methenyltetrahydrofolate cyclohydrolase FolD [Candidatus Neomarinimicrobiota bacterium]
MLIDGKKIAKKVRRSLEPRIDALKSKGITPGLAVILIGDDPASQSYVRMKEKAFKKLNMESKTYRLAAETPQSEVLELIDQLNADKNIHGILVQIPVPDHLDEMTLLERIDPQKDADGIHPVSLGKMVLGIETPLPCTPHGILKLLEYSDFETEGKHVVVIGRSNIVGKPISNLLAQKKDYGNATVTICHSRTKNIKKITKQADILIVAIGQPEMITGEYVKDDVVVIDVGSNRIDAPETEKGYRFVGDVDFEEVSQKAQAITPVPGGVGPMTISMLLFNTVYLAEKYGK